MLVPMPTPKVVPRSRIPRSTSHFSYGTQHVRLWYSATCGKRPPAAAAAAPLWPGSLQGGLAPAGACSCRTLGLVGPSAEGLRSYLEGRYAEWRRRAPATITSSGSMPAAHDIMRMVCTITLASTRAIRVTAHDILRYATGDPSLRPTFAGVGRPPG